MKRFEEWLTANEHEKILLERCRDIIRAIVPNAEVILYGSRARGDATPNSDYDLLVVVDDPITPELEIRIARPIYDLELEMDTVISVQVYPKEQWDSRLFRAMPFHQNVEREGVRL